MLKFLLLITLFFAPMFPSVVENASVPAQEQADPPYAKWGLIAMKATKEKYPNAAIIDYLHVGATKNNGTTTETFKLWLRGEDKEFGVYIAIRFQTDTEQVIDMTFTETDR